MTAQEIIEKIRAEVNRLKPRIRKICGKEVKIPVEKVREKFDTLLSFLSVLEKECSIPNDLEKYASRSGFDYVDNIVQENPGHRWNDHDVEFAHRDGIIAGAEWQREKSEKPTSIDFEQELYKHFGQVKDFTLGMQIGKYFYNLGKQSKQPESEGEAISWMPTEKDLMMLEHIIGQYEIGNKNCKTMGYLPRVEELNFLKKVLEIWKRNPLQEFWKPSAEQLFALGVALDNHYHPDDAKALESLYEKLKSL